MIDVISHGIFVAFWTAGWDVSARDGQLKLI